MALRWGLRLAAEMPEDRPLPYATSEAVRTGLTTDKRAASRAIRWLERHELIWSPASMPARGKPDGTKLFLPGRKPSGPLPDDACCVEASASVGRTVGVREPHVEVPEQVGVRDTPAGGPSGLGTTAGAAVLMGDTGHVVEHTPRVGVNDQSRNAILGWEPEQ